MASTSENSGVSSMHLATENPRCELRTWRPSDRYSLCAQANNPRVWRWLAEGFPKPYTLAAADAWIAHAQDSESELQLAVVFGGAAIGNIGVRATGDVRRGHIGYWIGEAFWGLGLATAAGRAFVEHLRAEARFDCLETLVYAGNTASERVLEKLGFITEGPCPRVLYKDGRRLEARRFSRSLQVPTAR
ncbi:MAG: GNAT family N-acetyltransferase [Acidithiobacillus sp.]